MIMIMIIIIVNNDNINCCEKSFSTGLFLQFTFSYSITTAKIEQYVSDMLKKTLSRLL